MKHLFICLLAVLLTACSSESSSNPTHETVGDFTPLIHMTKYEMESIDELNNWGFEYYTYGEIYAEPIEDWPYDLDKHVTEDNNVIGYNLAFQDYDEDAGLITNLTMDNFSELLEWVFNLKDPYDADAVEITNQDENVYEGQFDVSVYEKDYIVTFEAEKLWGSDDYGINDCQIWLKN